jgi:hypothetical protein
MPVLKLTKLKVDEQILPTRSSLKTDKGGFKLCIIGRPGKGKSVLIRDLLYNKMDIIPAAMVICESEENNSFYESFINPLYIHDRYSEDLIAGVKERQVLIKNQVDNPWMFLVMDDCMGDKTIYNSATMKRFFKNSRHWNVLSLFSCQYVLDFKPEIRACISGVFIFHDLVASNREKIYKNFASVIPTFRLFCEIMDSLPEYHCIYIDNFFSKSRDWRDYVYYYKADPNLKFQFGSRATKMFAKKRLNMDERSDK